MHVYYTLKYGKATITATWAGVPQCLGNVGKFYSTWGVVNMEATADDNISY